MQFNQNPEDLVDDETFLHATYQAGLQVEKKKALKQAKETIRSLSRPSGNHRKKDEKDRQDKKSLNIIRKGKENEKKSQGTKEQVTI